MKNIKAIIFDLGGVLLNISYKKTITEFTKIGIENSSSFYSKKSQTNIFNLLETGSISEEDFVSEIKKSCKNASSKQILFAWNAMLLDLPGNITKLLKNLKTDYSIFLLSNTNTIHVKQLKNILGDGKYNEFFHLFDKIYYSHEIKLRKPDKKAFQIILEENNLNPKNVLFIDDSPQHIEGAKKLGIKTYHLLDNESVTALFPDIIL